MSEQFSESWFLQTFILMLYAILIPESTWTFTAYKIKWLAPRTLPVHYPYTIHTPSCNVRQLQTMMSLFQGNGKFWFGTGKILVRHSWSESDQWAKLKKKFWMFLFRVDRTLGTKNLLRLHWFFRGIRFKNFKVAWHQCVFFLIGMPLEACFKMAVEGDRCVHWSKVKFYIAE